MHLCNRILLSTSRERCSKLCTVYLLLGCIHNPIDLVFVLDGSGSVGPNRFGLFKLFVQKLVLQLNVGEHGTKVAVLQLGDIKETKFEFGINNYSDVSTMLMAIENIKYQYGRLQKTEIALRMAETEVRFLAHLFLFLSKGFTKRSQQPRNHCQT